MDITPYENTILKCDNCNDENYHSVKYIITLSNQKTILCDQCLEELFCEIQMVIRN